ncbi:MAG: hypothetical protein IJS01_08430 [Lentisphaeria bacterium]|nr:hypothetical protein [Lentisphaeria bacterium]
MHFLAVLIGGNALVLKEKAIDLNGPCYVRLSGRKGGLIDLILTIIGVNTTQTLEIYEDRVEYIRGSLSGNIRQIIPTAKISDMLCGFFRPVLFLILGIASVIGCVVCLISASWVFLAVSLILAALFLTRYWFKKTTLISITADSSSSVEISFRRSMTHSLSEDEARQVVRIINELVRRANFGDDGL